jgi:hypothetical protein
VAVQKGAGQRIPCVRKTVPAASKCDHGDPQSDIEDAGALPLERSAVRAGE